MSVSPWVWVATGIGGLSALVSVGTVIDTVMGALTWFVIAFLIDRMIRRRKLSQES